MAWRLRFYAALKNCLLVLLLGLIALIRTDGFDLSLLSRAEDTATNLTLLSPSALTTILSQPYHYLGKGRQAFVFVSHDDRYVVKVFNRKYFTIPFWTNMLPVSWQQKEHRKRALRQEFFRTSYALAFQALNEADNLLYIHRTATKELPPLLVSTWGTHQESLPLNQLSFVVQKKGYPLLTAPHLPMEQIIDAYLLFVQKRIAHHLADCDRNIRHNFGWIDMTPCLLDPGRLRYDPLLSTQQGALEEWNRSLRHFRRWLTTSHPEALPLLQQKINEFPLDDPG